MRPSNSNDNLWRIALAISGMGVTLVAFIVLGIVIGHSLVKLWDGPRLWIGLGAIAGLIFGILNIIWLVRKFIGGTE